MVRLLRSPWLLWGVLLSPLAVVAAAVIGQEIEYLADPAEYLLKWAGETAIIFFIVVMAIGPLRDFFPKAGWARALAARRRPLGVAVFVYALAHFLLYLPYVGSWAAYLDEWNKLFILAGMLALLLLLALAITSNNFALRRLGKLKWKRLHLLTYVIMALLIYHQAAQEKDGVRETFFFFGPLLLLEAARWGRIARRHLVGE